MTDRIRAVLGVSVTVLVFGACQDAASPFATDEAVRVDGTPALALGDAQIDDDLEPGLIVGGTKVVANGIGLTELGAGSIGVTVPGGATVVGALLYWGARTDPANDPNVMNVTVGATSNPVIGVYIGTSTSATPPSHSFRSDLIAAGFSFGDGLNTVELEVDPDQGIDGASLVITYDDGSVGSVELREGNDFAFLPDGLQTELQTFTFPAEPVDRVAALLLLVGDVEGERPTRIEIVSGGTGDQTLINQLGDGGPGRNGEEWDTYSIPVTIPAGENELTAQLFSHDDGGLQPASLYWVLGALEVPTPPAPQPPQLIIEKTPDIDGDTPVFGPGSTAFFEIKVTNLGPGEAVDVVVDDDLPPGAGPTPLTWSVAPALPECEIAGDPQHLHCDIPSMMAGAEFVVRVESVIPAIMSPPVPPGGGLAGTNFNATDGNLQLDNSEVPSAIGAPPTDGGAGLTDWESFAGQIDCATSTGCAVDVPDRQTDDSYTGGAKEDQLSPRTSVGSIPPSKDDLSRWYFVDEVIGGSSFLYAAWIRTNQLATATIDFELNQSPDLAGNGVNPVRTEGDALLVYDFRGGRVDRLDLLRWLTSAGGHSNAQCEANNGSVSNGCWGDKVELLSSGMAVGSVNFDDNGTNKPTDDGYSVFDPIMNETVEKARFGEAAIDLTRALGDGNQCIAFAQAFVKSRASSSFTSELKDFIRPVPADINTCEPVNNEAIADAENNPGAAVTDVGSFWRSLIGN